VIADFARATSGEEEEENLWKVAAEVHTGANRKGTGIEGTTKGPTEGNMTGEKEREIKEEEEKQRGEEKEVENGNRAKKEGAKGKGGIPEEEIGKEAETKKTRKREATTVGGESGRRRK
jgi:hypothetical protein